MDMPSYDMERLLSPILPSDYYLPSLPEKKWILCVTGCNQLSKISTCMWSKHV